MHTPLPATPAPNISQALSILLLDAQTSLHQNPQGAIRSLTRAVDILSRMSEPRTSVPSTSGSGLSGGRMRRVDSYIAENIDQPISAAGLSAAAGLSSSRFARAFKTSRGVSPHQYVMRARIERAKLLMLTTSEGLSEIALACGLADQSHFSRLFHRLEGETPTMWRRRQVDA